MRGYLLVTTYPNSQSLRLGVVMKRAPGATRWAKWAWQASGVLPGAGDADWKLVRSEGDLSYFHAATKDVWLYVSDSEAYAHELSTRDPSIYVVLRPCDDAQSGLEVAYVTVSPYEAQDYCDSGEEIVEKVPMPPAVVSWVHEFVKQHHVEEPFVKRRRNKDRIDRKEDGIGDDRISQTSDVYRAPKRRVSEAAE